MERKTFIRLAESVKQAVKIKNGEMKPSRSFIFTEDSDAQIFQAKLSKRGTITIPAALRRKMGLFPGSPVVLEFCTEGFLIRHPRPGEIPGIKPMKGRADESEPYILCVKSDYARKTIPNE